MECLCQKEYCWRNLREPRKPYERYDLVGISKSSDIFSERIFKISRAQTSIILYCILYTLNEYFVFIQLPCTTASLLKKKVLIQCHLFIKEADKFL